MYVQNKLIKIVGELLISKGHLITIQHINEEPFLCKYNFDLTLNWKSKCIDYFGFKLFDNKIFVFDNLSNTEIFDEITGKILDDINNVSILTSDGENGIIYYDRDEKSTMRKNSQNVLLWSKPQRYDYLNIIYNKIFIANIFYNKKKLFGLEINSGEIIWTLSLENTISPLDWSSAEIVNIIEVIDGILWLDIVLKSYGGVLVGLDVQTGKIKHLLAECIPMNYQIWYEGKHLPYYCHSRYDKESNKIIGAVASIYWEVDLSEEKPIIKRWNFEKELEKYHAEFRPSTLDCAITPTHIITPVGGAIPRVVAFNRESHQIDWCYEFLEESTTIPDFMPLKAEATNTHLFVLISTGDLYIFEKTKDN